MDAVADDTPPQPQAGEARRRLRRQVLATSLLALLALTLVVFTSPSYLPMTVPTPDAQTFGPDVILPTDGL